MSSPLPYSSAEIKYRTNTPRFERAEKGVPLIVIWYFLCILALQVLEAGLGMKKFFCITSFVLALALAATENSGGLDGGDRKYYTIGGYSGTEPRSETNNDLIVSAAPAQGDAIYLTK